MDHRAERASPLGGGRGIVSERGVNFVDKDMEEDGGLVVWIRLYLRIDRVTTTTQAHLSTNMSTVKNRDGPNRHNERKVW